MLKKIFINGLLLSSLFVASQADFLRIEGNVGLFDAEMKGNVSDILGNKSTIEDITGFSKEKNIYADFNIKHPIPILPNIKLSYLDLDYQGTSSYQIVGPTTITTHSYLKGSELDTIIYWIILFG